MSPLMARGSIRDRRERGQGLVEFSLALIPFVFLLMAVIDLGRGIYTNNGVAQAAREVARAASVHPCSGPCALGLWSPEIVEAVDTQRALVPGLRNQDITIDCVSISDTPFDVGTGVCPPGKYVRVSVSMGFQLVTPFLPIPNPFTVSSTAHVEVP